MSAPSAFDEIRDLSFVVERAAWPVAHVVNPFILQVVLQNDLLTIVSFALYETLERVLLYFCPESYCVFGRSEGIETINEAILGDVFQGFIGFALGKYFLAIVGNPCWWPSLGEAVHRGIFWLWAKRILMYAGYGLSFIWFNQQRECTPEDGVLIRNDGYATYCGLPYGVLITFGIQLVVTIIFYFWNRIEQEKFEFWLCADTCKFNWRFYNRFFCVFLISIVVLQLGAFHRWPPSGYGRSWIHAAALAVFLSILGCLWNRGAQVKNCLLCGAYNYHGHARKGKNSACKENL